MSNDNIEQITVKDSKVEPFYIYLGILFVAGVYAFHAPILSALSRWTSTNKAADEDANDERFRKIHIIMLLILIFLKA